MEFSELLEKAQSLPIIDTKLLSHTGVNPLSLRVQISRWVKSGKLIQLKRELYLLAEPFRKVATPEFYIANAMKSPSYISLEKALEFHGLIPEAVSVFTSITTKRPEILKTPAGIYDYRHIQPSLFWGYVSLVIGNQTVFMATAEKALLDFFYLRHGKVSVEFLDEMRLQNIENIRIKKLLEFGRRFKKNNLIQAAECIQTYIQKEFKKGKRL